MTTDSTPIEVESNGITVEKAFQRTDDDVTRVVFTVSSARETPVEVELDDEIPDAVPKNELGLHPEYGRDRWTVAADRLTYRDTVAPGGEVTTLYGVKATQPADVAPFRTEPALTVTVPDGGEATPTDGGDSDDEAADPVTPLFAAEGPHETPSSAPRDASTAGDRAATDGGADAVDPAEALGMSQTDDGEDVAESEDGSNAAVDNPDASSGDGTDGAEGALDELDSDDTSDDGAADETVASDETTAGDATPLGDEGAADDADDTAERDDANATDERADGSSGDVAEEDAADDAAAADGDGGAVETAPAPTDSVGAALATELAEDSLSAGDRETLREELAGTSQSLDLRLRDLQSTVQDLQVYRDALESFIDERGDGATVVAEFEERLDRTHAEMDALADDVEAVTERLASVTDRLESVDERIDDVVERVEDVDDSVEAVRSDVAALDDRREEDVERLDATLDSVEADVEENARFRERMARAARSDDTAVELDTESDGVVR